MVLKVEQLYLQFLIMHLTLYTIFVNIMAVWLGPYLLLILDLKEFKVFKDR